MLNIQFDESSFLIDKSHNIILSAISNGFDWIITDARETDHVSKRVLRVRAIYDSVNDETLIKIHQDPVLPRTRPHRPSTCSPCPC